MIHIFIIYFWAFSAIGSGFINTDNCYCSWLQKEKLSEIIDIELSQGDKKNIESIKIFNCNDNHADILIKIFNKTHHENLNFKEAINSNATRLLAVYIAEVIRSYKEEKKEFKSELKVKQTIDEAKVKNQNKEAEKQQSKLITSQAVDNELINNRAVKGEAGENITFNERYLHKRSPIIITSGMRYYPLTNTWALHLMGGIKKEGFIFGFSSMGTILKPANGDILSGALAITGSAEIAKKRIVDNLLFRSSLFTELGVITAKGLNANGDLKTKKVTLPMTGAGIDGKLEFKLSRKLLFNIMLQTGYTRGMVFKIENISKGGINSLFVDLSIGLVF
jgi:hypothetical protein